MNFPVAFSCLKMFTILLSSYFVGLLSPVLVDGYTQGCAFNQTIIATEESIATFLVNFTRNGSLILEVEKTSDFVASPVASIFKDGNEREFTDFNDQTWETRANINVQFYSDDDIYNVRIHLSNVSMKDNGTYRLTIFLETSGACFTLFILRGPGDPLALVPIKKYNYLVNGDILPNITCTSDCNPPCKISWGNYSDSSILSLGAVTTEDTGEYTCTATRADGQAVEQTISIYVDARQSHHLVLVPEQKYYNLVTGDIMPDITCTSDCNPSCNISWGKHDRGNTLSLGAVTTENTGEYMCTARRPDGQIVKQSIIIFVTDKCYFIHAIACSGTVLTIHVFGLIIFFIYKRRTQFCCHNCKHDVSKRNKPSDAIVTFSQSTIQVSGNENYEDLKDETRNINNIYSEVNPAIKEEFALSSAHRGVGTIICS